MSDMRYSEYVHSYGVPNTSFCRAVRVLRTEGSSKVVNCDEEEAEEEGDEEEEGTLVVVVVVGGVAEAVTVRSC